MNESPVKIDILLEPLLGEASDEQVNQLLSQLITVHAEPVIKGVIRFKLRLNSYRETQRAEADDIHQEVVLQLVAQLQRSRELPSAPIEFDELVSGLAAIQGITDQPIESLADDEDAGMEPPSAEPDQAWRVEKRIFLQRLWEELQQLPVNQRAALLLNLKDASGFSCHGRGFSKDTAEITSVSAA